MWKAEKAGRRGRGCGGQRMQGKEVWRAENAGEGGVEG